jgi:hypothetical protein
MTGGLDVVREHDRIVLGEQEVRPTRAPAIIVEPCEGARRTGPSQRLHANRSYLRHT